MAEQRKHDRVPVSFGVTCIQADGTRFEGSARDLSVGGMFIECEQELPFAATLTLVLNGVASKEMRLPAIVRWSEKKRGFGVQFGLLGAYATHVLVGLVNKKTD